MARQTPADTERDLVSASAAQPVASHASRRTGRFGVIAAFTVVVALAASFAVVFAMSHRPPGTHASSTHLAAPAVTPTASVSSAPTSASAPVASGPARPAAGCPAPPAGDIGGPILYWARPLTTSRAQAFMGGSLCGFGFHPGERVTLTVSPVGSGISPTSATVIADSNGSFIFQYASDVNASCPGGSGTRVITARGDHGSTATIMVPGGGPELGIACYAP